MGNRQRKNFLKLFRKYSKVKKTSIDWCDTAIARGSDIDLTDYGGGDMKCCHRNSVKPPTNGLLTSNTSVESCPNDMNLRHELLDKLVRTLQ